MVLKMTGSLIVGILLLMVTGTMHAGEVDPAIPSYEKVSGVSGNLNSVGSDTLNNLMTLWAEGFQQAYPSVRIQIEGKGSSTAPPALIESVSQLAPMSRRMKASEIDKFVARFGYKPTMIPVAIDALAVYVHKDNPIEHLSLSEVDAIFSSTLKCGSSTKITDWGTIGLDGSWSARTISKYGRNSASGTYGYFKKIALCKGDYRNDVKEQPGSASVVQGITEDLAGIGYSGIGYKTSGVRTVPLSKKADGPWYDAVEEHVMSGKYPLARFLYVYVNHKPGTELDPLIGEFLKFVLSQEGQEIVVKDGYLPMTASQTAKELAKI